MPKAKFFIRKDFKKYLEFRKITQVDLEKLLKFKKQQISNALSGDYEPTMHFLHKLCTATGLKLEEIVVTKFIV